jgi:TolB-like protein/DNA-binding winged helix-turn-helix (wHTH) protein/tetratricopeptide (TPR) repeat protein
MLAPSGGRVRFRFGDFEVDLRAGEFRRKGKRIKLGERPLQVLAALIENPGEVVTREELQQKLWPANTFVDFEHSINTAVNKLREALGDSPEHPRFIETLPRHGYRFIYPLDSEAGRGQSTEETACSKAQINSRLRRYAPVFLAGGALVAIAAILAIFDAGGLGSRYRRLTSAAVQPPPQIRSIAVLPLENLSTDPGQDFFADAMTEELITNLGKSSGLRVISRTSVMRYKGVKKPLPKIAKELNVDAVVEGTVMRSGDRVRITANLLHAPTDRHLWAETYDRELKDTLAVESDVTGSIAYAIRTTLTPHEEERPSPVPPRPVSVEAYEAYLKGRYYAQRFTVEGFEKSNEYLAKAIAADPDYAPAYAARAENCSWGSLYLGTHRAEVYAAGHEAARRALELDPTLAEAHEALADLAFQADWDWDLADREFRRALELNPNLVTARQSYARYLMGMGRPEESIAEYKRAQKLDPLSLIVNTELGWAYGFARRVEEASTQFREVLELDPNFAIARYSLAKAYVVTGKNDAAIREFRKAVAADKHNWAFLAYLGYAYGRAHQPDEALKVMAQLQQRAKKENVSPYAFAVVHLGMGHNDQALSYLEEAYQQRDAWLITLKVSPELDPLRSNPRFQALVRRMNFPR